MIIKDKIKLQEKCSPVSVKEGEEIGIRLLHELRNSEIAGVGIAANQIGINKRVCIINVKEPIVLINPKIVKKSKETFVFPESCLSFPKKYIRTLRHTSVTVESDNHTNTLSFSAESEDVNDAFECACVQHEIDHLDGITMFDRKFVKPAAVSNKIGRNEKVTIEKGSETKILKYKKAESLMEDGWVLAK